MSSLLEMRGMCDLAVPWASGASPAPRVRRTAPTIGWTPARADRIRARPT